MDRVRALVVDDEPLARRRVLRLLKDEPDIEVVGECADGREAVDAIRTEAPDLVFLDVQMPEVGGFEVVEAVGPERMPAVIFVTAFDQYAVKAFEVHALDYLLKPFPRARFARAVERVRDEIRRGRAKGDSGGQLLSLLQDLRREGRYLERLAVQTGGRVIFLRVEEVDWIEAEGNYLRLHVGGESHLVRGTMKAMEARLDPERFIRIHRSTLVSVDRIREVQPWFRGEHVLILRDGTRLTTGGEHGKRLREILRNPF